MRLGAPVLLGPDHDVSGFDCGKPALNAWLHTYALGNQDKGFTRVIVVSEGSRVVAFYGLAPTAVPPVLMSRALRTGRPPETIPCILLGQFAVDLRVQGRGIAAALLRDALDRCLSGAAAIGGRAVIVRAIDADAAAFWERCGFIAAGSDRSTLFRSIRDIAISRAAP